MTIMHEGARGPEVRKLQLLLNAQRLPGHRLDADGSFGRETLKAVKLFQQRAHLEVDGVVGAATWHALGIEVKPNQLEHRTH